jgi:hypothetical protein
LTLQHTGAEARTQTRVPTLKQVGADFYFEFFLKHAHLHTHARTASRCGGRITYLNQHKFVHYLHLAGVHFKFCRCPFQRACIDNRFGFREIFNWVNDRRIAVNKKKLSNFSAMKNRVAS